MTPDLLSSSTSWSEFIIKFIDIRRDQTDVCMGKGPELIRPFSILLENTSDKSACAVALSQPGQDRATGGVLSLAACVGPRVDL